MRNLKKVLSLVLCMAMMLSIMVVGAGAAFKDQSKIVNEEAVDMCSALNIINGYTDGSFKPEGTITRAEACKMICVALNGGKEPVLGTNATATFTDIKGHWAEKYIEYCVSLGVVAGVGGGKFDPNGNVTGSQFAKMLLIGLGYNAEHAKFLGTAWEVNVNVVATQKGLYEDLATMDPAVALSRDNAAQMVWNALQAMQVKYEYTLVSENGQLVSKVTVKDDKDAGTLLKDKYNTVDTEKTTGILVYAEYDEKDAEYTYYLDGEQEFTTAANYVDLLGQEVTFVVKADKDSTVYGAFVADSVVVASALVGDYEEGDDEDVIEIDGTEYDVDAGLQCGAIYTEDHTAGFEVFGLLAEDNNDGIPPYFTATAIDQDGDDDIDLILVLPVMIDDVTYVGKDYIKTTEMGKLESADYTIYKGAEKEDIVLITPDLTLITLGTVTEIEEQSGKIASRSGDNVVIGGDTYDYSLVDSAKITNNMNKNVEFYAYNGYLLDVDVATSVDITEYAVITKIAGEAGMTGPQAKLLFTDGTEKVVDLAEDYSVAELDDNDKVVREAMKRGDLVKFDIDDGEYELEYVGALSEEDFDEVDVEDWIASESIAKANAKVDFEDGNAKFAADAVVFVYDTAEDEYVVKTGADVAKITGGAEIYYAGAEQDSNRALTTTFAYIATEGVSASDALYGYVVSDITYSEDSDGAYETVTIWNGSKNVDLTTAADKSFGVIEKGSVISYKVDAEGAVTSCKPAGEVGELTVIDGDYVTITGTSYEIDEDTVIMYVDNYSKPAGEEGGAITVASENEDGGYYENVWFVADKDDVLELLIVDVDNDWYGAMD